VSLKLAKINSKLESIQLNLRNYEFVMTDAKKWLETEDEFLISHRKTDRRMAHEKGDISSRLYSLSENSLQTIPSAR